MFTVAALHQVVPVQNDLHDIGPDKTIHFSNGRFVFLLKSSLTKRLLSSKIDIILTALTSYNFRDLQMTLKVQFGDGIHTHMIQWRRYTRTRPPGQMTWLEDPPPWLWLSPAY